MVHTSWYYSLVITLRYNRLSFCCFCVFFLHTYRYRKDVCCRNLSIRWFLSVLCAVPPVYSDNCGNVSIILLTFLTIQRWFSLEGFTSVSLIIYQCSISQMKVVCESSFLVNLLDLMLTGIVTCKLILISRSCCFCFPLISLSVNVRTTQHIKTKINRIFIGDGW